MAVAGLKSRLPNTEVGSDVKGDHLFLKFCPLQFVYTAPNKFSLRSSFLRNLHTRAMSMHDTKTPNATYSLHGNQARM